MAMPNVLNEFGPTIITAIITIVVFVLIILIIRRSNFFVYISSNEFGVVEKVWSRKGSSTGFISLDGRAGYQPDVIRTGPHFFVPFLYRIHKQKLITVRS